MDRHINEMMVDEEWEDGKPAAKPSLPQAAAAGAVRLFANDDTTSAALSDPGEGEPLLVAGELPFLVTHWLAGYHQHTPAAAAAAAESEEQTKAVQTIERVAGELAAAFATLGAFGTASRPLVGQDRGSNPLTYHDMKRAWSSCPMDQLQHLLQSNQSASMALDRVVQVGTEPNQVQASTEALQQALRNPDEHGGRTLQDPIVLDGSGTDDNKITVAAVAGSALQKPVFFVSADSAGGLEKPKTVKGAEIAAIPARSCVAKYSRDASSAMRHYLDTRAKSEEEAARIRSLQQSLDLQRATMATLERDKSEVLLKNGLYLGHDESEATALAVQLEEIKNGETNCERVIAQLELQLPTLRSTHNGTLEELVSARERANKAFCMVRAALRYYRDPVVPGRAASLLNNRILLNVTQRQFGIDRCIGRGAPRSMGRIRNAGATLENRKALLYNRLSYAATINTHLSYPVYCLRFDRNGRYFITGADDYLVKVFCIGGNLQLKKKHAQMPAASYARGAVLVCTLKGHAGVINDIEVSSDNSFLATASEDGDCRVWGLTDGCPVAILRGHTGGANMVSWSTLTPYRLVTTGADGLARTWDVREACLKRYGRLIGNRPEYSLQVDGKDLSLNTNNDLRGDVSPDPSSQETTSAIPPVPARGEASSENAQAVLAPVAVPMPGEPLAFIPPPPLPPAAAAPVIPPLPPPAGDPNNDQVQLANDGQFVANDKLDAGVRLVSKLQHGATHDERMGGPGTRARRSAVKVICVSHCPYGGHFATGSDDGICRVWREESNSLVEKADSHFHFSRSSTEKDLVSRPARRSADRLLFTLKGHLSAITDLKYSKQGDRLLTASQKDGVVRLWSWKNDPALMSSRPSATDNPRDTSGREISHILLKLTNPKSAVNCGASTRQGPRSRASRNQSHTVSCDCAVWLHDDTKVVTSQSELAKQNGAEIVPGSQYLFLWDSFTGHCLLGISGGHSAQCPVVLPHPLLPTVMCTAAADGTAKVWDWANGRCVYSHTNTGDFGPIDASDRGKCCGYLDGDFSPDGTNLVLADDSGRITIFDSNVPLHEGKGENDVKAHAVSFPDWMKEQYFSNDYYDLFYDLHGYCVERGSEMPPHLAPKGARCSHLGSPFSAVVNETFKGLAGPIPLEESAARWHRIQVRETASRMLGRQFTAPGNLVRQFDPNVCRIIQYGSSKSEVTHSTETAVSGTPLAERAQVRTPPSSARRLSSNYRWIGINDVQDDEEEGNDQDSDDEEFELGESRRDARARARAEGVAITEAAAAASEDSDSEELEADDERIEPSRTSSRHRHRRVTEEDDDDDDDMDFTEYMSTNNHPTGPFIADYNAHFFKMNSGAAATKVKREWVHRTESTSSYEGRKKYTPQIGDSVVYIPRAHFETIADFPNLETPWQSWPEEAAWPVVQCCVRNIRYRFPFQDFWNGTGSARCDSVVAKVTLEITGIPQLSNREVSWPSPTFTAPTRAHVFELSVFENDKSDFIVPLHLYVARLRQLEQAYADTHREVSVEAYFAETEEDAQFVSWIGRAVDFTEDPDYGQEQSHPSLSGSGYNSVRVVWEDQGEDTLSPWEVSLKDAMPPQRPSLTDDEKRTIRRALNAVKGLRNVDAFRSPVDESYYSDYRTRVEVPMDLTFITTRLEADYYSTKYSVVADVRLIQTNCAKYNGDHDDLTELAGHLVATFEDNVFSDEEKKFFHEYDLPISGLPVDSLGDGGNGGSESMSAPTVIQRRTGRQRRPPRSILEDVAGSSPEEAGASRENRAVRPAVRLRPSRVQRTESSILEAAVQSVVAPTLEQLSSNGHGRGRTARTRHSNQRAASHSRNIPQRSARADLRNSANRYPSRDVHEETEQRSRDHHDRGHGNTTSHRSLRPGLRNSQSRDSFPSEEEGNNNQRSARVSSRLTSRSLAQEELRRTRQAVAANDDGSDGWRDEEMGHVATRGSSRRSTRSSAAAGTVPNTGSRLAGRSTRGGTKRLPSSSDDAASSDEPGVNESDFGEDFDGKGDSSESESEISVEASSIGSEISTTRISKARATRSRAVNAEDESIEIAHLGRRNTSQNRGKEALKSHFHSNHARSARRRHKSYVDPSESEFGSDMDSPESSTKPLNRKKSNGNSKKRKASPSGASRAKSSSPPRKKKRVQEETRQTQIASTMESLSISKWPEIPVIHISKVALEILDRLRNMDEAGNFLVPVVESFPEIADDYLASILNPMDFRTIEEERLNIYQSIADLQDDLILVFSNCMEFNVPESDLYAIAQSMLESLEETFLSSCDDVGVRSLHHRSR